MDVPGSEVLDLGGAAAAGGLVDCSALLRLFPLAFGRLYVLSIS
jgi:hypothetical protein